MPQIRGIHVPKESNTKNYIINGDMRIAQRGTSFAAILDNTYSLDRWHYSKTSSAVHTITQDTDVPTFAQAGYLFQNSLRLNLTTADTSIAAGDFMLFDQKIEGYNFANIAQKPFTVSFWVKATVAGIYCISMRNSGGDRSYVAEYTVNTTNTWEYKTITVVASPSGGTWDYKTGVGLQLFWTLASGSTYQTTPGTWQTGTFFGTSNQVNGVNTGATDFRITGVIVNEGSVAAPFKLFENDVQGEMVACQRYYEKNYDQATAPATTTTNGAMIFRPAAAGTWTDVLPYRVLKRAVPSITIYNPNSGATGSFRDGSAAADKSMTATATEWCLNLESGVSLTGGNQHTGHWVASAEL